ncbi:UNVERIFIED_CONTAM: hypothetical protein Sradi_7301900 [Sesamum radiatum]|uniref:Reverse transcriptase n=1 Tax=Sesamum radiatum TaxID=300843 RepID=A0AAW2I9C5_SESRA
MVSVGFVRSGRGNSEGRFTTHSVEPLIKECIQGVLITVLYGDYDIIPRRTLWGALCNLSAGTMDEPWLVLGDFNAVLDDSEVCGRAADTSASMLEFRNCIRDTGLVQLPATGCQYTWHNFFFGEGKLH